MTPAKIKLVTIGHLPRKLNLERVVKWKSSTYEILGEPDSHMLRSDAEGDDWIFTDEQLRERIPDRGDADFIIAIVNVPLEANWYSRRLGANKIVFTFHEIRDILAWENIPLENAILRVLYAYTLLFRRAGNTIPDFGAAPGFTHDETRGCLFDMNPFKADLVESCHEPIVCDECVERLRKENVADQTINATKREIHDIRKPLYFRLTDFVKTHPVVALVVSSGFALFLGVTGSLIASAIYDLFRGHGHV